MPLLALIVISVAGCGASASVHVGGSTTLDNPDQSVAQALVKIGEHPKAVSCPDEVPAANNHQFRCKVTATDGTQYSATVTESEVSGEHVHLHVQVDKHPVK